MSAINKLLLRWSFFASFMGAACAAHAPAPPATAQPIAGTTSAAAPAPALEPSVRPGANAEYLKSDLDVQPWIDRFERSGRDIYDHRHAIVRSTGVRPGAAVADVGAGTGLFTTLFAQAVGGHGRVYAVDIVPKFLAHIERRAKQLGVSNVVTIQGSERTSALPDNSVDLVFICDAYHHFEYPRGMMASIHKALRPGGILVVIDFKRVPGQSAAWVLDHVRAGQDVFAAEIESAGFAMMDEIPLLQENYLIRFRKTAAAVSRAKHPTPQLISVSAQPSW